jgi:hypothetical protein
MPDVAKTPIELVTYTAGITFSVTKNRSLKKK